ncbi:hypothetical protein AX15_004540 [Amanita polypyramis BW_CC]|nr:hypothetical protein AX15_004540 [Amanita polypyramis BW_CC]
MLPTLLPFLILLYLPVQVASIKFNLQALRYPAPKCIWNTVHTNTLVIVTANVGPGDYQRVDIEIIDSSSQRNVYLSKRGISGEARLAITTHEDGEVGVCLRNYVEGGRYMPMLLSGKEVLSWIDVPYDKTLNMKRVVDLDVDIGADAVDYNAIANHESLFTLETEMRKLEGIVKEISEEMTYLKRREEKFTDTNVSTNGRVQNFAWFTIFSLVGLGVWQIFHLHAFLKHKNVID